MTRIFVHELLNIRRLLCIEVTEITIDDSREGIVWHLDGVNIHGYLPVLRSQQFLHLTQHLLTGFLRELFQINLVLMVVSILTILKHLDVTANGHGVGKYLIPFLHSVIIITNDNRQAQGQRDVIQLHLLGQTAYFLYSGLLLKTFQAVGQLFQYLLLHLG